MLKINLIFIVIIVQLLILNINKGYNMKHTYLSEATISEALSSHAITTKEADKLKKKIDTQVSIFKSIKK